jgi:hypothetical protein
MRTKREAHLVKADRFYYTIIEKLNNTIETYHSLPDMACCREHFEVLEQAAHSRDAQINHLLSITNCLLQYLPNSPAMEQVFTNFMKDYIHLVNPEMPAFEGFLYLHENSLRRTDLSGFAGAHPYHQQT